MPALNWIGKNAVVNHHNDVSFHLLKDVAPLACGTAGNENLASSPFCCSIAKRENIIFHTNFSSTHNVTPSSNYA
jgi:hypothetical protein